MRKIFLLSISSLLLSNSYASLPLPSVVPDAQPGGGIVASMRAQQELQRQYIEMQMMREQLAMMQQQRAMEMQAMRQEQQRMVRQHKHQSSK